MPLSTRDLSALSGIPVLRKRLQSLATLDAMLSPEWEYRFYSFNANWSDGEAVGSMRDGEGNGFFAHFTRAGCFFKGFAHEAVMAERLWPGVLDTVPAVFQSSVSEPAFAMEETTFAFWRETGSPAWQRGSIAFPPGPDPDGSAALLSILDGRPESYVEWAIEYYLRPVDAAVVEQVYRHAPLKMADIARLNRDVIMEDFLEDVAEIGYPPVLDFP